MQRSLGPNSTAYALRSPAIYQTLRQVIQLAPNHLSAEFMLRAASNRLPATLSLSASLGEIWSASAPVHKHLFEEESAEAKKNAFYPAPKLPPGVVKVALERINWLNTRLHPKAKDLKVAMADYLGHMDMLRQQAGVSDSTHSLNLAKRDRVLSELVKLGTDRNTLEELMH